MKFTIDKDEFLSALKRATKAISANVTMPVLECIYIEAEQDNISVIGSDLNFEIAATCPCTVAETGNAAIPATLFTNLVSKMPVGDLTVETDDKKAILKNNDNKYEIPVVLNDYPRMTDEVSGNICIDNLKEIFMQCSYPCSETDSNIVMRSVLFDNGRAVGIDSARIAVKEFDKYDNPALLIPVTTVRKLSAILNDETVDIAYSDKHIRFTTPSFTATSVLLEGKFFDVTPTLSQNDFSRIIRNLDRKELINALETLSLFTKESDRCPVLFDISDNLRIHIKSNFGEGEEKIPCNKEGADLEIAFNPKFLIQALKTISDDTVNLYLTDEKSPLFIKGTDYTHIIMPVNIQTIR